MSGAHNRYPIAAGWQTAESAPPGFRHSVLELLFGVIGVALITLAAIRIRPGEFTPPASVGPGTVSLLYLVVVVFVSLRAGLIWSVVVSLTAIFCLNYFFLPLFPALQVKNPLDIVATAVFLITAWVITGIVARLRERNALLDGLFEQAPESIALANPDSRVVRVNREFTRVFGYTSQETVGRPLGELIVPREFSDEFQNNLELMSRKQRVDAETIRRRKDGSRLHVRLVSVPVFLPSRWPGRRILMYATYRDITERKAAEIALEILSIRLMDVQETERAHLARELHDEIGQLLTGLLFLLTQNRIERARSIVDDLLTRVHGLSFDLRPAVLDKLGLLPALLALFDRYTAQTGVRVDFKHRGMQGRLAPELEIGAYRVVQEALTNAARHAGVSGITVRVWTEAGKLNLEIEDRGCGFDPEAVLKAPRSGGLIGMRERIKLLGGRMAIESSPGTGTTITAELPLDKRPELS
jgi:PAS domain S-box-containing protein